MVTAVEKKWYCYILQSVESNKTYVGATDNVYRRLCDHNRLNCKSKGAKATKGEMWYTAAFISGFPNKIACLSFEAGLKRCRKRKCKHLYAYTKGDIPLRRRIVDLYNLLHIGSPLNKWVPQGLTINWLERDLQQLNYKLPEGVSENVDINKICLT
jgi:predicted GIY-YIG superfamily endonuclease